MKKVNIAGIKSEDSNKDNIPVTERDQIGEVDEANPTFYQMSNGSLWKGQVGKNDSAISWNFGDEPRSFKDHEKLDHIARVYDEHRFNEKQEQKFKIEKSVQYRPEFELLHPKKSVSWR